MKLSEEEKKARIQEEMEKRVRFVCEKTGWDPEYARKMMLRSKKVAGSTFEYYAGFRLWEFSEEEQKTFFLKRDADLIVNKFNTKKENIRVAWNKQIFLKRFSDYLGRPWVITSNMNEKEFFKTFAKEDKIIYKPKSASAGAGIQVFDLTQENIGDVYRKISKLEDGVVEGFVHQHPEMQRLSKKGVNTIRVVTCCTETPFTGIEPNKVYIAYAAVRMCAGDSYTDNAHQGGMVAGVDLDKGEICTDGYNYRTEVFSAHPDTGTVLNGFKIPYFEEMKEMICKAGLMVPGYFGWDIAISEKGPVVIELNSHPGAEILQMPYVPQRKGMRYVMERYINAQPQSERKPENPYGLKISDISKEGIEFYWKKLSLADGYEVYRGYNKLGPFELIYEAPRRNIGTYRDNEFDHSCKKVFYSVKSFLLNSDGSRICSEMAEAVEANYITSLCFNRKVTYLYDGAERELKAVYGWGEPDDGVWKSSDKSVATVNQEGRIRGIATGSCDISYSNKSIGDSCSCRVIVNRSAEEPLHQFSARFQWNERELCWNNPNANKTHSAVIMMAGDMMCGKAQMNRQYSEENGWDFCESFEQVKEITQGADLAIANLETLMAPGWPYMADETYINNFNNCNAPARFLEATRYGGFDVMSMSNNHNCDGGVRALKETIDSVDRYQYIRTGIFKNCSEDRFVVIDVNGIKVGFLAYMSAKTGFNDKDKNWTEEEKESHLHIFSREKAKADIQKCRAAGAEYIIVYMHWGEKNFREPTETQKREAVAIANAGADFIVGANPHLIQQYVELITRDERRVPCYYSVGNFLAAMNQMKGNRDSVIARIVLCRDAFGKIRLMENHYIPCHVYGPKMGYNWAPIAVYDTYNIAADKPQKEQYYNQITESIGDLIVPYTTEEHRIPLRKTSVSKETCYEKKEIGIARNQVSSPIICQLSKNEAAEIRRGMEQTGWSAYDTYCRFSEISEDTGKNFKEIITQGSWSDYKYNQIKIRIGEVPVKDHAPVMSKKEFDSWFYVPEQKKAMQDIRQGRLTLSSVIDYLQPTEYKLGNLDISEPIDKKISYRLRRAKPGDILFSTDPKEKDVDLIGKIRPSCIVSYPANKDFLESIGIPYILCNSLRSFMWDLSSMWQSRFTGKTIAITGSVGKTTTRQMITNVVKMGYDLYTSPSNLNTVNPVANGVFKVRRKAEAYVQECGTMIPGGMEGASRVLRPDIFVLTNVGNAHIGNYGGVHELLMYEKLAMDRNANENAIGVVNWDDPGLKKINFYHPVVRCAMKDQSADIVSQNVIEKDGRIFFDIVENNNNGCRTAVKLNVCGSHNVYNALSAFAVGILMNVPRESIAEALAGYRPRSVRQNLVQISGQQIYMDCYSATVESMETAMRVMPTISVPDGKKKIAVLADVPDLGEESEIKHRSIGRMAAEVNSADEIFFYGHNMRYAKEEAEQRNAICRVTDNRLELERWMQEEAPRTGLFVLKASHKMALQWVLDDLFGTAFYCYDEVVDNAPVKTVDGAEFKCIADYGAVLLKADKQQEYVSLPESVNGLNVRIVGRGVFSKSELSKISLPEKLRTIAGKAFANCNKLGSIVLPDSVQYIGEAAFQGCKELKEIVIPDRCETIEANAFQDCMNLKRIILPENLKTISDTAFNPSGECEFICKRGSYAEAWVTEKQYKIVYV